MYPEERPDYRRSRGDSLAGSLAGVTGPNQVSQKLCVLIRVVLSSTRALD
jgi:hypothetical protein